jgi:LPXTG-site transpeptidase (sortase) family protein
MNTASCRRAKDHVQPLATRRPGATKCLILEPPESGLGDDILAHRASQVHRYVVSQKLIVEPTEVSVLELTASPAITLVPCHSHGIDRHRIAVIGELKP